MFKKLKAFFTKGTSPLFEINYLYFSFALVFLIALSGLMIFAKTHAALGVGLYFLFYSIGQALLEVTCIVLLASWIKRTLPNWVYKVFIGLSFLFLLGHLIDFILVRLMDASIIYAFKLFFAEGITHFFAALSAMNINHAVLLLILALIVLIPLAGIGFYWLTKKIIQKKPLRLGQSQLFTTLFAIVLGLFMLEMGAKPFLDAKVYTHYQKTLPLGGTFLTPLGQKWNLTAPIQPPRDEDTVLQAVEKSSITAEKRPNIYLFVVETFREDYIEPEIAPHLSTFKKENISYPLALSNGNATHLSWFSIFHADFPFHWSEKKKTWNGGSIPIHMLKKMGYQTHVISSAELSYYKMNELLFGQEGKLIDHYQEIPTTWEEASCDRDVKAMDSLQKNLEEYGKEGNLFIVFLDSTHSEYSWPKNFPAKFTPVVEKIDYLSMSGSKKDLEAIKNRYKNSVSFVDHLFGGFVQTLKNKNLYQDSIIVITGDHGEEFFEQGAMFHGTHLNNVQTRVPLYYKFGENKTPVAPYSFTSQMDIFPSILHYLSGQSNFSTFFDGESIFSEKKWPYVLSVKQNGGETPQDFFIHDGKHKLLARFPNTNEIYTNPEIEVVSIQDTEENEIVGGTDSFQNAFLPITQR